MTKIKGFTPAPDYLCKEYDPLTALVYGKVWRYTDWKGECSASQERIADELGISSQTVRRKLKALEESGFIEQKESNPGRPNVWVPTGKLEIVVTIEANQPLTESNGLDRTPDTESPPPLQKVTGTPDTESPKDSIDSDEDIILRRKLSSAFWTASKIPEPAPGGRGWDDWQDGIDALIKISATENDVTSAVNKLDELEYGYTNPGSVVKTIVNSRKKPTKKKSDQRSQPLPKGL